MLSWSFFAHTLTVPSMEELTRRVVLFGLEGGGFTGERREEKREERRVGGEVRKVMGERYKSIRVQSDTRQ